MATIRQGPRGLRSRFFLAAAAVTVAVALVGFGKTFFLSLAHGTFAAPSIFFIHGGLFFAWVLLATIAILWPAWFRLRHYFPSVPYPEYVFAIAGANLLLPIAMLHDRRTLGRVHPVYLWGGGALVIEQIFETMAFDTAGWLAQVLA